MPSFPADSVQNFIAFYRNALASIRPRGARQVNPTQILEDWRRSTRNSYNFDYPMYCRFARIMRNQYGYNISSPPCTEQRFNEELRLVAQPTVPAQEIEIINEERPAEPIPHIADFTHVPIVNIRAYPAELSSFFRAIDNGFWVPMRTERFTNTHNTPSSLQMHFSDGNDTVIISRITPEFIIRNHYQLNISYYLYIRSLMTNIHPRLINSEVPNRSLLNAKQLESLGEKVSKIPDRFLDSLDYQIMDEPVQLLGIIDSPEGMEDWVIVGVVQDAVYDKGTLNKLRNNPYTRKPLSECTIIPDPELKREIDTFMAAEMAKNPLLVAPLATKQFYNKPR